MIPAKMRHLIADTRGASLVEAGLVLPAFLLITFGAALWALTLWQQITLQHAVEMEARCAVLPGIIKNITGPYCGYFKCSTAQACAVNQAFGMSVTTSSFTTPTISTNGSASFCTATNNFSNKFSLGLIPQVPKTLNASYCRYSQ